MQQHELKKAKSVTQAVLYNIVEDLCTFLLREVIPTEGKYHDPTSVLANPEFRALRDISKLKLSRSDY